MYRRYALILPLLLLFFTLLPVQAHEAADIYIDRVWATPCTTTNNITSVFMTVDNTTVAHPIALISASSPLADHIHFVEGDGGCTEGMTDRIVIPFGERVDFQESQYAIAVELNESHEAGQPFSMTLTFDMLDEELNSIGMTVDVIIGVPVLEEAPVISDMIVTGAWVRPTIMGAMEDHSEHMDMDNEDSNMDMDVPDFPIATYLSLYNRGSATDYLVAASSPVADITELHESAIDENGVMRMGPIDSLELPAHQWVSFEPGGYHIMLIDVNQNFLEGEAIPLTLTFESGTEITIAVPVYDPTLGEMEMDHSMHMDHGDMSEESNDTSEENSHGN